MSIDPITILLVLLLIATIVVLVLTLRRRKATMQGVVLSEKYNTLAILSFVLAFFVSIAAIVLGHISLSQIARTNERGWGLALAGTILGYVGLIAGVFVAIIWISTVAAYR